MKRNERTTLVDDGDTSSGQSNVNGHGRERMNGKEYDSLVDSSMVSLYGVVGTTAVEEEGRKDGVGLWGTVFNISCTTLGAGILALPSSVESGGYLCISLVVITALVANFAAKRLIDCLHIVPNRPRLSSYADVGLHAMGPSAWRIVVVLQCGTLLGVATIFLILIGGFMVKLLPSVGFTLHDWVFIAAMTLVPIAWLKGMKEIQGLALLGFFASAFVGIFVFVSGLHRFEQRRSEMSFEAFKISGLPVAFNIMVFSFGGTSVLPTIEAEMRHRKKFPLAANIAYSMVAVVYICVTTGGYLGWSGEINSGSGNITDVMDASVFLTLSRILITMHVFLAYPIPLAPVNRYLESAFHFEFLTPRQELVSRVVLRTSIVLVTVFTASVIPYFGNVLSLLSALTVILIVFVMPCVFYWKLSRMYRPENLTTSMYMTMLIAIVMGSLGTITGTYYGFDNLIDSIDKNPNPFYHYFKK